MFRIPYRKWPVTQEMRDAVLRVLETGEYRTGSKEEINFEKEFSRYIGCKYAVAVSSGAGALHIAMCVLGVGPGDEVITAANAFTAAADCAVWVGAKPVFAEIDSETMNIDPDDLRRRITSKTKVIIPIHAYGHPADMDPIMELAAGRGLSVVEDVAQAAGSKYQNRRCGSIGHISIFSFAGKNITCCHEGGMLVTDSEEYAKSAVLYRHFGHDPNRFGAEQHVLGYNYSMSGWNAALGRISLRSLDDWNEKRRENASMYDKELEGISNLELPVEKDWAYHSYLHYVVRTRKRDALKEFLEKKGIQAQIHYPIPTPLQAPYKKRFGYTEGMYPKSEEASKTVLSLPTRFNLTEEEVRYVSDSVREFLA
jgi:perosamine synthetase